MLSSPQEPKVAKLPPEFERYVFINCPFDDEYVPIFEAVVFAVHDAGFRPKCARERLDSSEIRLQKIVDLIRSSRYSIHDLSRTELDQATALPRFNMPLELGIDLGCKIRKSRSRACVTGYARNRMRRCRGGAVIYDRYERFRCELPALCDQLRLDVNDLPFVDFSLAIALWLQQQS